MRDAGHRTAENAKIIYPPPWGVDIITIQEDIMAMSFILMVVKGNA